MLLFNKQQFYYLLLRGYDTTSGVDVKNRHVVIIFILSFPDTKERLLMNPVIPFLKGQDWNFQMNGTVKADLLKPSSVLTIMVSDPIGSIHVVSVNQHHFLQSELSLTKLFQLLIPTMKNIAAQSIADTTLQCCIIKLRLDSGDICLHPRCGFYGPGVLKCHCLFFQYYDHFKNFLCKITLFTTGWATLKGYHLLFKF